MKSGLEPEHLRLASENAGLASSERLEAWLAERGMV